MSSKTKLILVLIPAIIAIVGFFFEGGGNILPVNVDSPFPADGWYLLVSAETSDMTGVEPAASAESIRSVPGLDRRVLDYDKVPPEPWNTALQHAKTKSGGKPYYVARHGNKAVEGPLTGEPSTMLTALTAAIEATR